MFRILSNSATNVAKATTQTVNTKVIGPAVFRDPLAEYNVFELSNATINSFARNIRSNTRALTPAVNAFNQIRYAHTDFQVPDLSSYRRKSTQDPQQRSSETSRDRNAFTYLLTGLGAVSGAVLAKAGIRGALYTLSPGADELALSKIEVNLNDVPLGSNVTFKWRGSPLFVRHRTKTEIDREAAVNVGDLRDPQHDSERVKQPEWLVVIGICTHLGCVPISNLGEFGGYYCPCHGSHYDASGRVRKGPAPLNLAVPEYEITGNTLVVG